MSEHDIHINLIGDEGGEEPEEVTRLKPTFARLTLEMLKIQEEMTDETERREALERNNKEFHRAAFLTNQLATEEDFERLWPRMRDDGLCEHADIVYRQTMNALTREYKAGKSPDDYVSNE